MGGYPRLAVRPATVALVNVDASYVLMSLFNQRGNFLRHPMIDFSVVDIYDTGSRWEGDNCDVCSWIGLGKCGAYGVPNEQCDGCICSDLTGYAAGHCGTRYKYVTIDHFPVAPATIESSAGAFEASVRQDIADALNISTASVLVHKIVSRAESDADVSVTFKLLAFPERVYEGSVFYNRPSTPDAIVDPLFGLPGDDTDGTLLMVTRSGTSDDALDQLASLLQQQVANASAPLYAGAITGLLPFGGFQIKVEDPRGNGAAAGPTDSHSSSNARVPAIAGGVIGGVALVAMAVFVVVRRGESEGHLGIQILLSRLV